MSRIGRKPIVIPEGVKVAIDGQTVRAQGPKGNLAQEVPASLSVAVQDNQVVVSRDSDERMVRALHGLMRSLVANMINGVKTEFVRKLDIVGIGYRAQMQGKSIQLALGYSHPVLFPLPDGVSAEIDKQTAITLRGADKAVRPRLAVFRSLNHIYAQLVDDDTGRTMVAADSRSKEFRAGQPRGGNVTAAKAVGELLAQRAKAAGVTQVVFDRGGYKYHGRVRA